MKKYCLFLCTVGLVISFLTTGLAAQEINVSSLVNAEVHYSCPMHADVVTSQPGKCAKCGMILARVADAIADEFIIKTETLPQRVKAGQQATIRFSVFNPKALTPVKDFNVQHEKLFHLFIVSSDLKHFDHIHPEQQKDGSFTVKTILPSAGLYHVYSDIFPVGGLPHVVHQSLVTAGFAGKITNLKAALKADAVAEKNVDGIRFTLNTAPMTLLAGQPALLRYQLNDVKTGEPVTDLEQYLGAWGHTMILSEDCTDFIHSHPLETKLESSPTGKMQSPAHLYFEANFLRPGNYRIWSQFQRVGKIITVSYDLTVSAPPGIAKSRTK